jgi:hypothetical protein
VIIPGIEDRTLIIGRTGSGKTYFGLWLLSEMPIDEMPWLVIDYKRDKSIARIPYIQPIEVGVVPTNPGVYVVRPFPTQDEEMSDYLMQIWDTEGIGLYIDEGVMLARNDALDAILIQGRSKQIPVIMLSQRPVGISRFAFSESQYFVVFPNHDKRERKTIAEFTPIFAKMSDLDDILLPRFHSYHYDVVTNKVTKLSPVPDLDVILKTFERKLKPPEPLEKVPDNTIKFVAL